MFGESYRQFEKIDKEKNPPSGSILMNTYLKSDYAPQYKGHLFLEFKKSEFYEQYFEGFLKEIEGFVDTYDTKISIVFIFAVPFDKMKSYKMFSKSKYSLIDEEYKRHILRFHSLNFSSRLGGILYKQEALYKKIEEELNLNITIDRDQEIGSLLNLRTETHRPIGLTKHNKEIVEWD